jgi:hypothetical protein
MEMVNKYIIDHIDTEAVLLGTEPSSSLNFNATDSVLSIRHYNIKITRKSSPPIEHFMLIALFSQEDIAEPIEFHQIARDVMNDSDYDPAKGWTKFRSACDKLNQKVDKSTKGEIKDFVIYSTGRTGWCKINHEYL